MMPATGLRENLTIIPPCAAKFVLGPKLVVELDYDVSEAWGMPEVFRSQACNPGTGGTNVQIPRTHKIRCLARNLKRSAIELHRADLDDLWIPTDRDWAVPTSPFQIKVDHTAEIADINITALGFRHPESPIQRSVLRTYRVAQEMWTGS